MSDPILTVGPPPHRKIGASTVASHYAMALALLPAVAAAVVLHGLNAVLILALAVFSSVAAEALAQHFMRQPIYALDGHAVVMGLVFGLLMPPSVPFWIIIIGAALASVVAKQIFGGLGCYPFHPAMIGYLMVLLSWPLHLQPVGGVTLGTACPYAMAAGGLLLVLLGLVNRIVPIAFLAGVFIGGLIFHAVYPETTLTAVEQLLTGNVMLGAFFLVTDETTSPANLLSKILFGLMAGVLVVLIRVYGIWMEVVPFAVLLGNMAAPMFDRIRPKSIPMEKIHA